MEDGMEVLAETIITFGAALFSGLFLLSILVDYCMNKSGLRKGATLLAFLAVLLLAAPGAQRLSLSLGSYEVLIESAEETSQSQIMLSERNLALERDVMQLSAKLDQMQLENREQTEQLLAGLLEIQESPKERTQLEKKELIDKLVPEKSIEQRQLFQISAHSLRFDQVCEIANNTGEFYWSFLANGQLLSERKIENRHKARAGTELSLEDGTPVIVEKREGETSFRLGGQLKEWDGKTFWRRAIKITDVGSVAKNILLEASDEPKAIRIEHPNSGNVCSATLFLNIDRM